MHESVLQFFRSNLTAAEVGGKLVLEVGSYDVNGSIRPIVEALRPKHYLGCDMRAGPGVDVVADIATTHLGSTFDLVCCVGTLEHMQDWRACVCGMKNHLADDGLLLLTTVAPGFPLHDYPSDYWRFTLADLANIFSDMHVLVLAPDPQVAGVFIKAKTRRLWRNDLMHLNVFAMEEQ